MVERGQWKKFRQKSEEKRDVKMIREFSRFVKISKQSG